METVMPYVDMSEVGRLDCAYPLTVAQTIAELEKTIKTPIAFATISHSQITEGRALEENGWKPLRSALNWHNLHIGDHEIRIYMKKFEHNPVTKEQVGVRRYHYKNHLSLAFTCGVGLISNLSEYDGLGITYVQRFLTIMRVSNFHPLNDKQLEEMCKRRFSQIAKTPSATYYANGWPCDNWNKAKELVYWSRIKEKV